MAGNEQVEPNLKHVKTLRTVLLCVAVFAATLVTTIVLLQPVKTLVATGANDFLSFYAGGRLAFDPGLYNPERIQEVQKQAAGVSTRTLPFTRLPVFAALWWPLAQAPYAAAYAIWQIAGLFAVVVFVAIWRASPRHSVLLALVASIPLQWSFANAQDLPWLLVCIAIALRLLSAGSQFWAGASLSLCLSKYHLILVIAFMLLLNRNRQIRTGFLCGFLLLLSLSFATAGIDWPQSYVSLLLNADIDATLVHPNLFGLLSYFDRSHVTVGMTLACLAWILYLIGRRATTEISLGTAILCSLLVTPHLFVQDLVLLLPICLVTLKTSSSEFTRLSALWLLTPFPYIFELALPFPAGQGITLGMLLMLIGIAREQVAKAELPQTLHTANLESSSAR